MQETNDCCGDRQRRAVDAPSGDAIFAGDNDWSSRPKRKREAFLGFVLDDL
jgi:hypothetical protein